MSSSGHHASHPQPGELIRESLGLLVLIGVLALAFSGLGKVSAGPLVDSLQEPHTGLSGAKIQEVKAKARERLGAYGVINKDVGLYEIPITVAMAEVAKTPALLGPMNVIDIPLPPGTVVATGGPALGEKLYTEKGCLACHSLDGSKRVGPTFKGIFGRSEVLADNSTITVDDAYIKESLLTPAAKLVQGYPPAMPAFQGQLTDTDIDGIIAYLKTLK